MEGIFGIESPIRYEKKKQEIIIDDTKIKDKECKIVDIKENLLKRGKYAVCYREGKVTITPIKKDEGKESCDCDFS